MKDSFETEIALEGMIKSVGGSLWHLEYLIDQGGFPDGYGGKIIREAIEEVKAQADLIVVNLYA